MQSSPKMSEVNKWFYSLTLNELQQYIVKLEDDNDRMVRELTTTNRMNGLLESIVKSTQIGYSLLRRIEINKNCECNEHRNQELRKALNESISETNLLLNHLHQLLSLKDNEVSHGLPLDKYEVVDITCDDSNESIPVRPSEDKEPTSASGSPNSSGYDSMDVNLNVPTVNGVVSEPERLTNIEKRERSSELMYRHNYSSESHSTAKRSEELPQNLSKPKSPHFSPITASAPTVNFGVTPTTSAPQVGPPLSAFSLTSTLDKTKLMSNKCSECDLQSNSNLKPNLDHHLLTHINTTFTVQRAGRGRPAKNDPRVLRVTDSDLNILRMNEALVGLPEGVITLSALEELRRTKLASFGRYRCPWPDCGYTPHFLRDLRRHMFKHTGDKKYKCDLNGCDFITVWKTSLLQHQRKKHNITEPSVCSEMSRATIDPKDNSQTPAIQTNPSVITNIQTKLNV